MSGRKQNYNQMKKLGALGLPGQAINSSKKAASHPASMPEITGTPGKKRRVRSPDSSLRNTTGSVVNGAIPTKPSPVLYPVSKTKDLSSDNAPPKNHFGTTSENTSSFPLGGNGIGAPSVPSGGTFASASTAAPPRFDATTAGGTEASVPPFFGSMTAVPPGGTEASAQTRFGGTTVVPLGGTEASVPPFVGSMTAVPPGGTEASSQTRFGGTTVVPLGGTAEASVPPFFGSMTAVPPGGTEASAQTLFGGTTAVPMGGTEASVPPFFGSTMAVPPGGTEASAQTLFGGTTAVPLGGTGASGPPLFGGTTGVPSSGTKASATSFVPSALATEKPATSSVASAAFGAPVPTQSAPTPSAPTQPESTMPVPGTGGKAQETTSKKRTNNSSILPEGSRETILRYLRIPEEDRNTNQFIVTLENGETKEIRLRDFVLVAGKDYPNDLLFKKSIGIQFQSATNEAAKEALLESARLVLQSPHEGNVPAVIEKAARVAWKTNRFVSAPFLKTRVQTKFYGISEDAWDTIVGSDPDLLDKIKARVAELEEENKRRAKEEAEHREREHKKSDYATGITALDLTNALVQVTEQWNASRAEDRNLLRTLNDNNNDAHAQRDDKMHAFLEKFQASNNAQQTSLINQLTTAQQNQLQTSLGAQKDALLAQQQQQQQQLQQWQQIVPYLQQLLQQQQQQQPPQAQQQQQQQQQPAPHSGVINSPDLAAGGGMAQQTMFTSPAGGTGLHSGNPPNMNTATKPQPSSGSVATPGFPAAPPPFASAGAAVPAPSTPVPFASAGASAPSPFMGAAAPPPFASAGAAAPAPSTPVPFASAGASAPSPFMGAAAPAAFATIGAAAPAPSTPAPFAATGSSTFMGAGPSGLFAGATSPGAPMAFSMSTSKMPGTTSSKKAPHLSTNNAPDANDQQMHDLPDANDREMHDT